MAPSAHWIGDCVGPRAYLDILERSLLLLQGIEPNHSVNIKGWKEVEGLCVCETIQYAQKLFEESWHASHNMP